MRRNEPTFQSPNREIRMNMEYLSVHISPVQTESSKSPHKLNLISTSSACVHSHLIKRHRRGTLSLLIRFLIIDVLLAALMWCTDLSTANNR